MFSSKLGSQSLFIPLLLNGETLHKKSAGGLGAPGASFIGPGC